jgi:tRNA(fMet)-specific endonuclease VapC
VKAELIFGASKSAKVHENLERLEQFFQPFQSLPFDDSAAVHYGQLRAVLEREGRPVGANDMMIASIALAYDVTLMTRNMRKFSRIAGLRVLQF